MSDRIFGVFGVVIAALYIWQATVIEESFISDPVGPKTFPIIIGLVLGLSSAWFVFRPDADPAWPNVGRLMEIVFAVAVMVGYAYALPSFGFVLSTAIAASFLSWRLGAHPISAMIAGIIIAFGIYAVFHLILGLSLARGPWGF